MWLAIIHLLAHWFVVQYSFGLRLKFHELTIISSPLVYVQLGKIGTIGASAIYFLIVGPKYRSSTYIYCDLGRPSSEERRQILPTVPYLASSIQLEPFCMEPFN